MRSVLVATAILFSFSVVHAAESPCTPELIVSNRMVQYHSQQGQNARETIVHLDELESMMKGNVDPKKSVGEQMSHTERARFEQIRLMLLVKDYQALMESAAVRNFSFIAKAASVAARMRDGEVFDEKSPEALHLFALLTLRPLFEKAAIRANSDTSCTMDKALALKQEVVADSAWSKEMEQGVRVIADLMDRYKATSNADWTGKLTIAERQRYETARRVLERYRPHMVYALDLEGLRALAKLSDESTRLSLADIDSARDEGELNAWPRWNARLQAMNEHEKIMARLLDVVGNNMPSDKQKELVERGEALKRVR